MSSLVVTWHNDWMRAERIGALRNDNSPFPDKYDLMGEEKQLRDAGVLGTDGEVSSLHPLYERLVEFEARSRSMQSIMSLHGARAQADPIVSDKDASKMKQIGSLTEGGGDELLLHTRDAYRLFIGRGKSPDRNGPPPIPAAKKAAAALMALWRLSGQDNPYADYALIQFGEQIDKLKAKLNRGTLKVQQVMADQVQRGISIQLVQSRAPAKVPLGFKSPYGYEMAFAVSDFDYAVRHLRTASMKALLNSLTVDTAIKDLTREARVLIAAVIRAEHILRDERMIQMTRQDWLESADERAKQRVTAARELLGELPQEILNMTRLPKHHRQLRQLTPIELEQLNAVNLKQLSQDVDSLDTAATPVDQASLV